jgi:hypothetical protein
MQRRVPALAAMSVLVLAGCRGRDARPVQDVGGGQDVSRFTLTSVRGTRDGDRLDVRAMFGDGGGASIRVDLHFIVAVPTRLESGTWVGLGSAGGVREQSATFLGGQSGPPSLGGRFDLIGPDNGARYRVTIPLQELKDKL